MYLVNNFFECQYYYLSARCLIFLLGCSVAPIRRQPTTISMDAVYLSGKLTYILVLITLFIHNCIYHACNFFTSQHVGFGLRSVATGLGVFYCAGVVEPLFGFLRFSVNSNTGRSLQQLFEPRFLLG
jgi:hypothetical protein